MFKLNLIYVKALIETQPQHKVGDSAVLNKISTKVEGIDSIYK